jgi:hypothetical protein
MSVPAVKGGASETEMGSYLQKGIRGLASDFFESFDSDKVREFLNSFALVLLLQLPH